MVAVLINGDGIAASCCSHLLRQAGLHPIVERLARPRLPALMLSEATQLLLRDVFGREDLFSGVPRVRSRVVVWAQDSKARTLPHSAVIIGEQQLLERIHHGLGESESVQAEQPNWTIFASTAPRPPSVEHHFGSRMAAASPVRLNPKSDAEACWIESFENGWLFLLPSGKGPGWLLSVGDSVESLLERSGLIKEQIDEIDPSRGTFPSHPRIVLPLSEPGWLACGTAALGFDPLCGEGTGNAVREAILASAIIRAAVEGASIDDLVAHYQTRLLAGFRRHFDLCIEFYASGRSGPWWDDQVNELKRGLAWCSQQVRDTPAFRYRLNGFTLERL